MIGLLIDLFSMFGGKKKALLAKVVPRIKHVGFAQSAQDHMRTLAGDAVDAARLQAMTPVTRPFAGDLVVAYAIEGKSDFAFVGQDLLDKHKISPDALHEAAITNLRAQGLSKKVALGEARNFIGVDPSEPGIAASLALLPNWWKSVQKQLDGHELLVAIPGRDFVCFLPMPAGGEARDVALVKAWIMQCAAIQAFEASGNHALSEHVFRVNDGVFEVREQLGDQAAETRALLATPRGEALLQQRTDDVERNMAEVLKTQSVTKPHTVH